LQQEFGISRERQDEFAERSHRLAHAAWEAGFYDDLTVPVADLVRDEGIRADTSLEKLARLKPSFRPDGTITAGNASPLSDGASAVLVASSDVDLGRDPLARIAGRAACALEPQRFGYAPVEAANRALARAGIDWSDAWKVDPEIVNSRGGAIAIGHPLGASGGRILGTLAKVLRADGHRWGVAAICIGVGQGLAVVLENVS
jgi:acetyl-CoA acetyltransferase